MLVDESLISDEWLSAIGQEEYVDCLTDCVTPVNYVNKTGWLSAKLSEVELSGNDIVTVKDVENGIVWSDNATGGNASPTFASNEYFQFYGNDSANGGIGADTEMIVKEAYFVVSNASEGIPDISGNITLLNNTSGSLAMILKQGQNQVSLDGTGSDEGRAFINGYEGYFGENVEVSLPANAFPKPDTNDKILVHVIMERDGIEYSGINEVFSGNMDLHEAILFSSELSANESKAIEAYLTKEWDLNSIFDSKNSLSTSDIASDVDGICIVGSSVSAGRNAVDEAGWAHRRFSQDDFYLTNYGVPGTNFVYWLGETDRFNGDKHSENLMLAFSIGNENEDTNQFLSGLQNLIAEIDPNKNLIMHQQYAKEIAGGMQKRYDTNKTSESTFNFTQVNFMGAWDDLNDGFIDRCDDGDGTHPNNYGSELAKSCISPRVLDIDWDTVPSIISNTTSALYKKSYGQDSITVEMEENDFAKCWTFEFDMKLGSVETGKVLWSSRQDTIEFKLFVDTDGDTKLTDGTNTIVVVANSSLTDFQRFTLRFNEALSMRVYVDGVFVNGLNYELDTLDDVSPVKFELGGEVGEYKGSVKDAYFRNVVFHRVAIDPPRIAESGTGYRTPKASMEFFNSFDNDSTKQSNGVTGVGTTVSVCKDVKVTRL